MTAGPVVVGVMGLCFGLLTVLNQHSSTPNAEKFVFSVTVGPVVVVGVMGLCFKLLPVLFQYSELYFEIFFHSDCEGGQMKKNFS